MKLNSIRYQISAAVIFLVLASGICISQVGVYYYDQAMQTAAIQEAEHVALHMAVDLADKILTNDLVAIQKQLDDLILNNHSAGYVFIIKDGRIFAHTFEQGFPRELVDLNIPADHEHAQLNKIISKQGDRYLDIAMPIIKGKAGVLRLGFSESAYKTAVTQLHYKNGFLTLGILIVALILAHFFIKRISRPLSDLTKTVEQIGEDNLASAIKLKGGYEIKLLGSAFNRMIERVHEYTLRLKKNTELLGKKNIELDRVHRQSMVSLEITKQIMALSDLKSVSKFLINKMQDIAICGHLVLIVLSREKNLIFLYTDSQIQTIEGSSVESIINVLNPLTQIKFFKKSEFPLSVTEFQKADRIGIFPIHYENNLIGAMGIGCPGDCNCVTRELSVIHLILNVSAGAIVRAVNYEDDIHELKMQINRTASYCGIFGKDPNMQIIYKLIEDVAQSDTTILIQGESGTGKELVAQAIHKKSQRSQQPLIIINCSAYPETLLESELFGYEKGAFTGASQQKAGRFELADGGTVFLDEIGEISSSAQVKLLRVLQSKKFERLGGHKTLAVDVRIVAATNKNLLEEVKNGRFREDLFYRLNVIPINLPPLRNRKNDIPLLARHFLKRYSVIQDKPEIKDFNADVMRALLDYHWPGNVRELENSIEHAMVLSKGGQINVSHLPSTISDYDHSNLKTQKKSTILENEKKLLLETLNECNWNKSQTAQMLGISRSSIYAKLKKYQINTPSK